jgi:hypothetical protein
MKRGILCSESKVTFAAATWSAPLWLPAEQRASLSGAQAAARVIVADDVNRLEAAAIAAQRGEHRGAQVGGGQRRDRGAVTAADDGSGKSGSAHAGQADSVVGQPRRSAVTVMPWA